MMGLPILRRRVGAYIAQQTIPVLVGVLCALSVGTPTVTYAQVGPPQKVLCDTSGCNLQTVGPGHAVFYEITIPNSGPGATVTLQDPLPANFVPSGGPNEVMCGPTAQSATPVTYSPSVVISNLFVPSGGLVCLISGTLIGNATNSVTVSPGSSTPGTNSVGFIANAPLPSDLSITKTASPSNVNVSYGPQTVTFTITVTNNGPADVYLGNLLTIQDTLALAPQSVVLNATYVSATCAVTTASNGPTTSNCLSLNNPVPPVSPPPSPLLVSPYAPSIPQPFVSWRYAPGMPGLLKVGDKMVLTVTVKISRVPGVNCIIAPNSDGIINHADISLTLPGSNTTITEGNVSPNNALDNHANVPVGVTTGATVIDPGCNASAGGGPPTPPPLKVIKTQITPQVPGGFAWGSTVTYKLSVTNMTNRVIDSITMADLVQEGTETPPFTAAVAGFRYCPNASCSTPIPVACNLPICGGTTIAPPQQLLGNSDIRQMLGTTVYPGNITSLAPGQTEYFRIDLTYSNPECDSFPSITPKAIYNIERMTSWRKDVGGGNFVSVTGLIQSSVTTYMQAPPACPMKVTKSTPATRVIFGTPINYTVTYQNLDTVNSHTMGTMIDTMRFTSGYATQMQVTYNYSCAVTAGTVTGFNSGGFPVVASGTISIVPTQLPQQGVRIIQNSTPVVFGPNSTLTCMVTVTVQQPSSNDPYCSTVGSLENDAILDASHYYDPNTPWPTNATPGTAMWASTHTPLPRCFNLVVNKTATPAWTWQGGGPLSWTLYVTNNGNAITTGGPVISDTFTPSVSGTAVSKCAPPGSPVPPGTSTCNAYWSPAPTASNPSKLHITALASQQGVDTTFNIPAAPASVPPGGQICNSGSASIEAVNWNPIPTARQAQPNAPRQARPFPPPPPPADWFWQNPSSTSSQACIQVVQTAPLTIVKSVTNTSGLSLLPTAFQVDVNCNLSPAIDGPHTTVAVSANSQTTVQHVPVGSTCTIQEHMPLPLPPPGPACANPAWSTEYLPGPSTVILASGATLTVHNTFFCNVGSLVIQKTATVPPGLQLPTSVSVNVNCGPTSPVSVPVGGQYQIDNIPVGSICTLTEIMPNAPSNCQWLTTMTPASPVTIPSAGSITTVTISNTLTCPNTLIIQKTATVPPGMQAPPSVDVTVNCTLGGPSTTVTVPTGGQNQLTNVPLNSVCTVSELTSSLPTPPNCQWTTSQSPSLPVAMLYPGFVATVTIHNILTCGSNGFLTITKTADADAGLLTTYPVIFPVQVNCTLPDNSTTTQTLNINVTANGSFQQTTSSLPFGTVCTINELAPTYSSTASANFWAGMSPWCVWHTSYPFGQTVTVQTANPVLQIVNQLICGAPSTPTSITVMQQKTPIINGVVDYSLGMSFLINASCTNQTYSNDWWAGAHPLNPGPEDSYEENLITPPGSTCTWNEPTPPLPPGVNPASGCQWVTSYFYNGTQVAAGAPIQVSTPPNSAPYNWMNIQNQLVCPNSPVVVIQPVQRMIQPGGHGALPVCDRGSVLGRKVTQCNCPKVFRRMDGKCLPNDVHGSVNANAGVSVNANAGVGVNGALQGSQPKQQTPPPTSWPLSNDAGLPPATGIAVSQMDVTFDGPCTTSPQHETSDTQGRAVASDLHAGKCRLFVSPDALHKAAKKMGGLPHNTLPFDLNIGLGGGSGGSTTGGSKSVNGEPTQPSRGGSHSSSGGGISIGIPLGEILSSSKSKGSSFLIDVTIGQSHQQIGVPCCDEASLSKGASVDFNVPANDNAAAVVTVEYVKANKR